MSEEKKNRLGEDYPSSKGEIVKLPGGITTPPAEEKIDYPTEFVDLPSKGLIYPKNSALQSGRIEIKYMTAKEEDILTNQNYIQKGIVIDKLLESIIVTPINYNELTIGDKNALMIAARILGYGANYGVEIACPNCTEKSEYDVILTELNDKEIDFKLLSSDNTFGFELPHCKKNITFKCLTVGDEKKIEQELKFQKKVKKHASIELSTRLKYIITSIDGDSDNAVIRKFVDTKLLARDSLALRKRIAQVTPDIDMTYLFECDHCTHEGTIQVPMTVSFFWPNAGV